MTGILCDRKTTNFEFNLQSCRRASSNVHRKVLACDVETESQLKVIEANMVRRMGGVIPLDCIRNEEIWQRFGVSPIGENMREARLRWHGHFLRGKEDSARKLGPR